MANTEDRIGLTEDNLGGMAQGEQPNLLRLLCGEATTEAFNRLYSSLVTALEFQGVSRDDSEDAAQESLGQAVRWNSSGKMAEVRNPKDWLFKVALNAARTTIGRRREHSAGGTPEVAILPFVDLEDMEEKQVRLFAILSAMNELEPSSRNALICCVVSGSSVRGMARDLGLPEATLRCKLTNARRTIRKALSDRGFEIPDGG